MATLPTTPSPTFNPSTTSTNPSPQSGVNKFIASLKSRHIVPESFKPIHLLAVGIAVVVGTGLLASLALVQTSSDLRQQAFVKTYFFVGGTCSKQGSTACDSKGEQLLCNGQQWDKTGKKCSTTATVRLAPKNNNKNGGSAPKQGTNNAPQVDNNPEPEQLAVVPSDGVNSLICPSNARQGHGCDCIDVFRNQDGSMRTGSVRYPIAPNNACNSTQRIIKIYYPDNNNAVNAELLYQENTAFFNSAVCPAGASCICVNSNNFRDQVTIRAGQNCPAYSAMIRIEFEDGGLAANQEVAVQIRDRQANTCFNGQWYGQDGMPTGLPCVFGGGADCSVCPTGNPNGPCENNTQTVTMAHNSCGRGFTCDNGLLIPDTRTSCSN